MILADTSAWVEYLRGTGSAAHVGLRDALVRNDAATTDVVLMELLAGARNVTEGSTLRALLARCEFVHTQGPLDYEVAAEVYRACRRGGDTVSSMIDCLVAAVAIRHGMPVLHADADFIAIARHAPLSVR